MCVCVNPTGCNLRAQVVSSGCCCLECVFSFRCVCLNVTVYIDFNSNGLCVLQTMDQKLGFLVLLAAGLLCLNLIPICRAEEPVEDALQEDLDAEDELDPGFVGAEEDDEALDGDLEDEAPPAPKTPPTPKVRLADGPSSVPNRATPRRCTFPTLYRL